MYSTKILLNVVWELTLHLHTGTYIPNTHVHTYKLSKSWVSCCQAWGSELGDIQSQEVTSQAQWHLLSIPVLWAWRPARRVRSSRAVLAHSWIHEIMSQEITSTKTVFERDGSVLKSTGFSSEDLSSVPGTHVVTVYNSSPRGSDVFFWLPWDLTNIRYI